MAARKGTAVLLIVASAGLLLAAVPEAVSEGQALITSLRPAEFQPAAIAERDRVPAGSVLSKDEYFRACLDIPDTLPALLRPLAERKRLLESCRDEARRIQAAMPAYALPSLVDATSSAGLGEPYLEALAKARTLAPHVHWQADRRIMLARERIDHLDASQLAGFTADLADMFGSPEGRRALAMHFLRWPDMREQLAAIAETMPEPVKLDFLAKVKQQARSAL